MVTWPSTVPKILQRSGYAYSRQDGIIRTDMETGPSKTRRRFTAVQKRHKGQIIMTKAQFDTFETWFEVNLMMGALTFGFPDPLESTTTLECRFEKPYSMTQAGDTLDIAVTVELEVVPL